MRNIAEGVDDQVIQIFEQRCGGWRKGTEIGEIGGAAEAKTEDFEIAMQQRDGDKLEAH